MNDTGVSEALAALLAGDPDVADRNELAAIVRHAAKVKAFVEVVEVRCARRSKQLAAEGQTANATELLIEEGRRSGREAQAVTERDRVCTEFPGLEDALARGDVSTDHVDTLARLTKNLNDRDRSDLHTIIDDVIADASTHYVSEFERKTRNQIDTIRAMNRPRDDEERATQQRADSRITSRVDHRTGMGTTVVQLDPTRHAHLHARIDRELATIKQNPANAERAFVELQVEAFMNALAGDPPDQPATPEVIYHVDHETFAHGRHDCTLAETNDGVPVPVSTIERACCEAIITAVVVRPDGTVEQLATPQRTANRAQRRRLAAMYSTCAHPHCTVPFSRCRIHHVIWWTRGGTTHIDNLLPLCDEHHHQVHEGGWDLELRPDRTVTWFRPDRSTWWSGSSTNRRTRPSPRRRPPDRPPDRPPEQPPGPPPDRQTAGSDEPSPQLTLC